MPLDPDLKDITELVVADFLKLLSSRGGKQGGQMKGSSIAKHCRQLDTVLKFAGPRNRHNPTALNLIPEPPPIQSAKVVEMTSQGHWEFIELHAMFQAANAMTKPEISGIAPSVWWQTLLCIAFYTGLRITTVMELEFSMIGGSWLTLPPKLSRNKRTKRMFLHRDVRDQLNDIRSDNSSNFILKWPEWGRRRRDVYDYFRE
jgi:hypothetical protein